MNVVWLLSGGTDSVKKTVVPFRNGIMLSG